MKKPGFIFAMRYEVPDVIPYRGSRIRYCNPVEKYKIGFYDIMVIVSGMGARNARKATERLCKLKPDYIIHMGICGGVQDNLNIGDIVVPEGVLYNGTKITTYNKLNDLASVPQGINYHTGIIETFRLPVMSRNQVFFLSKKQVAKSVVAVDMESFVIADAAYAYNIPVMVIRAVSDIVPAEFNLKGFLNFVANIKFNAQKAKKRLDAVAEKCLLN